VREFFDLCTLQGFHFLSRFGLARHEAQHLVVQQVIHALKTLAHADRPGHRRALDLQHRLDLVQHFQRIGTSRSILLMNVMMGVLRKRHNFEQLDGLRFYALAASTTITAASTAVSTR